MAKTFKVSEIASEVQPFVPKIYTIGAMVADEPFEFDNEFGEGHYSVKPGDIILEGTRGEHWVVPDSKLVGPKAKYVFGEEPTGADIDLKDIAHGHSLDTEFTHITTKPSTAITWAVFTNEPVDVVSPEGDVLHAKAGYAICMGDNNGSPEPSWGCWPVKEEVFNDTYEPADGPSKDESNKDEDNIGVD